MAIHRSPLNSSPNWSVMWNLWVFIVISINKNTLPDPHLIHPNVGWLDLPHEEKRLLPGYIHHIASSSVIPRCGSDSRYKCRFTSEGKPCCDICITMITSRRWTACWLQLITMLTRQTLAICISYDIYIMISTFSSLRSILAHVNWQSWHKYIFNITRLFGWESTAHCRILLLVDQ